MTYLYLFLWIAAAGFTATLVVMGLFRFFERVSHGDARFLKIITMALLLLLTISGAAHWVSEEPAFAYTFLAFPLGICLLEFFFNKNSFMIRLLRDGLLTTIVLTIVVYRILSSITLFDFGSSGGCTFNLINQSGHEIILYEAHFNTKQIFKGKITLPHNENKWGRGTKKLYSREEKSKKLSLIIYDSKLKKVFWKTLDLPKDPRKACCDYNIIYDSKGFRHEPGIC